MATFKCPQCSHSQVVDDKHIGKNATCPKCKTQGTVKKAEQILFPNEPKQEELTEPRVRTVSGGRIGIAYSVEDNAGLNLESSLEREWIVIDDPFSPVRFNGVCGVVPTLGDGTIYYEAIVNIRLAGDNPPDLAAIDIHFLTFDLWGSHEMTLTGAIIRDMGFMDSHTEDMKWHRATHGEGDSMLASIGYIARVRTKEGKVLTADTAFVLREAQRFTDKITESDLESKDSKRQ